MFFQKYLKVGDIGKKGWSSLAGSNVSSFSNDEGYGDTGSNYQSSGGGSNLRNSGSYNADNDWNNDKS